MNTDPFDDLPPALKAELRALHAPPDALPPLRDEAILHAAHAALAAGRARRWRWGLAGGMAAALAITAGLWWSHPQDASAPVVAARYAPTGDIRDAFYVARRLQGAPPDLDPSWDVNRDGRIDVQDVQSLALAAVKIDGGARP
jgi:hypothetical protein